MKKFALILGALAATAAMPALADTMTNGGDGHMDAKVNYFFSQMDTNGDGKISRSEHQAFADKMFDAADTDHDGYLTRDELKAAKMKEMSSMKAAMDHTGAKGHNEVTSPANMNNSSMSK